MDEEQKQDKQHTYENWRAITESDFVTLFIKTWFAFVSTLREMYPDKAQPYYKATGDSPYITAYKSDYAEKIYFQCDYDTIAQSLHDVYQRGLRMACERYPRFLVNDFYSINQSFREHFEEGFESPGGYSGNLRLVVRNKENGLCKTELICSDKKVIDAVGVGPVMASVELNYAAMLETLTQFVEDEHPALPESGLILLFYDIFYKELSSKLLIEIEEVKNALPATGKQRLKTALSVIQSFVLRASEELKKTCLSSDVSDKHKLLAQAPVTEFLQSFGELTDAEKQRAFLWFVGYAYRLRNALFHEIIDPLDPPWQLLFKNAYLVLKHVVDNNIAWLKITALLLESAPLVFEKEFREAPPPDIPIESNDKTIFQYSSIGLKYYNQSGAAVHISSLIICKGTSYQVECDVRWDEKLENSKIKRVQITKLG